MDISDHIKAKSDQINAADLIGGPIVGQIEAVTRGNADQPVTVRISGGHMAWKPSKSALRIMAHFLGTDTAAWVGRWVKLYRDPRALWAGKPVGGVMVCGLSGIPKTVVVSLPYARGKTSDHTIEPLTAPKQEGAPTANLAAYIIEAGLSEAAIDAWRATNDKPPVSEMTDEHRAKFAGWLAGNDKALHEIRGLMATMGADVEGGE